MLMADDGVWTRGDFSGVDGYGNEDLSIDIETLFDILGEKEPQPLQALGKNERKVLKAADVPELAF